MNASLKDPRILYDERVRITEAFIPFLPKLLSKVQFYISNHNNLLHIISLLPIQLKLLKLAQYLCIFNWIYIFLQAKKWLISIL